MVVASLCGDESLLCFEREEGGGVGSAPGP